MPDLLPRNEEQNPNPNIPARPFVFDFPLLHTARCLDEAAPIRIVAIGSSSTSGADDGIAPYPGRLEFRLRDKFPNNRVVVLNRGKKGEEAPEELKRFDSDVIGEAPTLVIWQVGTNVVYRGGDLDKVERAIRSGLEKLSSEPTDVILMDLQYVPPLLTMDRIGATQRMVSIIEQIAFEAKVNVFRRFDFMRRWHRFERASFERAISPHDENRLHQSEWSTERIARSLFDVMVHALQKPAKA
jgi:hypothetical protein